MEHGEKALVFVRRVNSVEELKNKLDDSYDRWLLATLLRKLPPGVHARLKREREVYRKEKNDFLARQRSLRARMAERTTSDSDKGRFDTFFAWFFRGEPREEDTFRTRGTTALHGPGFGLLHLL